MPNDVMNFGVDLLPLRDKEDNNGGFNLGSSTKKWNIFGDVTGNATTATSATYLSNNTTAISTPSFQYAKGQLTIGTAADNATEGSSSNYQLWSYPTGGTSINSGIANIQNLRLTWGTTYFRDLFLSPNNNRIYHRAVGNGTAEAWRLLVQASTAGVGETNAPVYVDTNGDIKACTTYANATVGNATKVAAKLAATTKHFLLGTSTTLTSSAANVELLGDGGIYATNVSGELSAVRHSFNVSGAEKAYITYNSTDNSLDFIFI